MQLASDDSAVGWIFLVFRFGHVNVADVVACRWSEGAWEDLVHDVECFCK